MPRPTTTGKQSSQSASSGNFISRWFSGRKNRKNTTEKASTVIITNDAVQNEGAFLTELQQIRFHESKLPKERLEYRTHPEQRYGDLEYCVRWLEQEIPRNSSPTYLAISSLDHNIYSLILYFKEAVEKGYPDTAFLARAALIDVFSKIRFPLPRVLPMGVENNFARFHIVRCTEYVRTWNNLLVQTLDAYKTTEAIEKVEAELEKRQQQYEEMFTALINIAEENSDVPADLEVMRNAVAEGRLTSSQINLQDMLLKLDALKNSLNAYKNHAEQLRHCHTACIDRIEALKADLKSFVIPTDPAFRCRG